MEFKQFHDALRILANIDRDELESAGVLAKGDHNQWGEFRRNPFRWFIRVPDAKSLKLWGIIETRLREGIKVE